MSYFSRYHYLWIGVNSISIRKRTRWRQSIERHRVDAIRWQTLYERRNRKRTRKKRVRICWPTQKCLQSDGPRREKRRRERRDESVWGTEGEGEGEGGREGPLFLPLFPANFSWYRIKLTFPTALLRAPHPLHVSPLRPSIWLAFYLLAMSIPTSRVSGQTVGGPHRSWQRYRQVGPNHRIPQHGPDGPHISDAQALQHV